MVGALIMTKNNEEHREDVHASEAVNDADNTYTDLEYQVDELGEKNERLVENNLKARDDLTIAEDGHEQAESGNRGASESIGRAIHELEHAKSEIDHSSQGIGQGKYGVARTRHRLENDEELTREEWQSDEDWEREMLEGTSPNFRERHPKLFKVGMAVAGTLGTLALLGAGYVGIKAIQDYTHCGDSIPIFDEPANCGIQEPTETENGDMVDNPKMPTDQEVAEQVENDPDYIPGYEQNATVEDYKTGTWALDNADEFSEFYDGLPKEHQELLMTYDQQEQLTDGNLSNWELTKADLKTWENNNGEYLSEFGFDVTNGDQDKSRIMGMRPGDVQDIINYWSLK